MLPPKQDNYALALRLAFDQARQVPPEALCALGATPTATGCTLPVLNAVFHIQIPEETITAKTASGETVTPHLCWQVIALHYLCATLPVRDEPPRLTFPEFPGIRGYESVYNGRVLGRLCATAGRDEAAITQACRTLGATPVASGDAGFVLRVFPFVALQLAWYRGDDEFPPAASFLFPGNLLEMLPVEDAIVLAERIVTLLQGKPW